MQRPTQSTTFNISPGGTTVLVYSKIARIPHRKTKKYRITVPELRRDSFTLPICSAVILPAESTRSTKVWDPSATRGLVAAHKFGGSGGGRTSCSGVVGNLVSGDGVCTAVPGYLSAPVGVSERDNRRSGPAG